MYFSMMSGQDELFVIGYATALCAFFTITTIGYDEADKGYSFLFTLPYISLSVSMKIMERKEF